MTRRPLYIAIGALVIGVAVMFLSYLLEDRPRRSDTTLWRLEPGIVDPCAGQALHVLRLDHDGHPTVSRCEAWGQQWLCGADTSHCYRLVNGSVR